MPLLTCRPVPGRRVVLPWRDGVGLFHDRPPKIDLPPLVAHLAAVGSEGVYATGFSPEGEERIAWVPLERP